MKPPREIHLHIERLVLEGLPLDPSQGEILTAALTAELGQIFDAFHPKGQGGGAFPSVIAPPIHLSRATSAPVAASQFAQAVGQAVRQILAPASFQPIGGGARRDSPAHDSTESRAIP
jgi:hypothetical protein